MSYTPSTDFVGLYRNGGGGVLPAEMPGLDFVVAALARAGLITLFVGQTAPTVNQETTAWFKPALPTYSAEGVLFLWNAFIKSYQQATPALWDAMLAPSGKYVFQKVTGGAGVILPGVSLLAVKRVAPVATALTLPLLVAQWGTGRPLKIVDFSTGVVGHTITITPPADGSTIMQLGAWNLFSNDASLAGVTLTPSPDLNAWVITP